MTIPSKIQDGEGSRRAAGVTPDSALKVSVVALDSSSVETSVLTRKAFLSSLLVDEGGSSVLSVDGSTVPVEFAEEAGPDRVKFITDVRFVFQDTNMNMGNTEMARFGSAASSPGLTNGVNAEVVQNGIVTSMSANGSIHAMVDFFNFVDEFTNVVGAISSSIDVLVWDMSFATPVVLPAGSKDRIVVRVNDDLTSMSVFNVLVRGWSESV